MYGATVPGISIYGDNFLGISGAEVTFSLHKSSSRIIFRGQAVFSSLPAKARIPELDINVDLAFPDFKHIPRLNLRAYGNFDEFGTILNGRLSIGSYAQFINPDIIARGPSRLGIKSTSSFSLAHPRSDWIAWSNIGELNFEINSSNVAGEMPLNIGGFIYAIEQLGSSDKIIVYAHNGIVCISPKDVYYSKAIISRVGIKHNGAVVNTGLSHYFISQLGDLYNLSEDFKLAKLGYREFLSEMVNPYMYYNQETDSIHICDGVDGYIYSIDSNSFSSGPNNITGILWNSEYLYTVASNVIVNAEVNILTDVFNMRTNKIKTISSISVNANSTENLYIGIQFRLSPTDAFTSIPILPLDPDGTLRCPCFGREFRFNILGNPSIDNFKIEGIKIRGRIHDYMYLDTGEI